MQSVQDITTTPSFERPHDVEPASPAPQVAPAMPLVAASLADTVVLLLVLGGIVVVCGVVTVFKLHPISLRAIAEWGMALIAGR